MYIDGFSEDLLPIQRTVSALESEHRSGLIAVVTLAFLSCITSVGLFLLLAYRLFTWHRGRKGYNQFVVLIFNLVLADIQQSMAFLLNIQWLLGNKLDVGSTTCWAQGWFVSTGDLASGVMTLAIGIHTFSSVIMNYRPSTPIFLSAIVACWIFIYTLSAVQPALHPNDVYVRAGAWCWIKSNYNGLRLWTHYFWIFIAEFGTIVIYTLMYLLLNRKIRANSFTPSEAAQARHAAKLMVVYPLVYVICTLPLASARMASMSMNGKQPSTAVLCFAGAMITSNGWLDVLLYTFTRRIMLFSDDPPEDTLGVAAFQLGFFDKQSRFGNITTITAVHRKTSKMNMRGFSRQSSMDELVGMKGVKAERTVEVRSDPMELSDFEQASEMERRTGSRKESCSIDAREIGVADPRSPTSPLGTSPLAKTSFS